MKELIKQWKDEKWGANISQDGLIDRGISQDALDDAVVSGLLGRWASATSSADHGRVYYYINED